jgi:hypothetical protein
LGLVVVPSYELLTWDEYCKNKKRKGIRVKVKKKKKRKKKE